MYFFFENNNKVYYYILIVNSIKYVANISYYYILQLYYNSTLS